MRIYVGSGAHVVNVDLELRGVFHHRVAINTERDI
jgi:hypothetical protein